MSQIQGQPLPGALPVEQHHAPYLGALAAYDGREASRYHVPGHKGGLGGGPLLEEHLGIALGLDIPACTEGIDMGGPGSPLGLAEALAAEAWGASRTWFLVNGATEGSHIACLALGQAGRTLVVQRNVHSSTMHGMVLTGLEPAFVAPEVDDRLGIAHCVTPGALAQTLDATPQATGAVIVSPTYFGAVADVRALAAVCHARGLPLVVDEAWGAHFRFSERLPEDALSAGADLVVSGTHKTLGSLTQSAMLHLGHSADEWLDEDAVERALGLVRTTSPSSLLLGSLDAARHHAMTQGEELLDEALDEMEIVRGHIDALPGVRTLAREDFAAHPSVRTVDPFRLAIDVRGSGFHGHALAAELLRVRDVNLELITDAVVVAHFGLGEPVLQQGEWLAGALEEALSGAEGRHARVSGRFRRALPHPPWGKLVMSPQRAYLAHGELVPLTAAAGRVSSESLVLYPPGIANVVPGELVTEANIEHLRLMSERGCAVKGTRGGSLEAIRVVSLPGSGATSSSVEAETNIDTG